ncbi:MAG TPA: hypothetical protein VKR06_28625 [Ktedonosporobacter sp.]|nr:hypothetical protein [Ktedonosporobacter sp.]
MMSGNPTTQSNGHNPSIFSSILERLTTEDAVGQLRRRDGQMATLGSENGELKLDWVEGVKRLLDHPSQLEEVEAEARGIWQSGIRHLIWAGMGGSILTVRVLAELGFCDGHNSERVAIYPLDSTDPAALNAIVRQIAQAKDLALPNEEGSSDPAFLRALLHDVMMVGVSMGMTSEEPITHLTWFADLLEQAGLPAAEHILVMTLPGSYLDQFAHERQAPSCPLQLDGGTGTGGRMSAPATRVFLLPAALYLTRISDAPGLLRTTLSKAWRDYDLDLATTQPAEHPFVQLAAACYMTSVDGACRVLVELPEEWQALVAWNEQLIEESLGKGGKGIVVFKESSQYSQASSFQAIDTLRIRAVTTPADEPQGHVFALYQPYLSAQEPHERLAAVATSFLSWQLTMALYGYLQQITFAGQPAVENYKARARALRAMDDPLQAIQNWDATYVDGHLTLLAPTYVEQIKDPATAYVNVLQQAIRAKVEPTRLGYLDLTVNGVIPDSLRESLAAHIHTISNTLLGVPCKLRTGPADYHSTEQSEMDGPSYLVSLRVLMREHEPSIVGTYNDAFLRAQAISTWQAMIGQGRSCFLLIVDGLAEQTAEPLSRFFAQVERLVSGWK